MSEKILIVDDEKNIRRTLGMILPGAGYEPLEAASGEEAIRSVESVRPDAVLLDVGLPGMDGIQTLRAITESNPSLPVIMISGQATIRTAVEATRAGAFDFLEKPLSKDRVLIAIRNALRMGRLGRRVKDLESGEAKRRVLVGESTALQSVRAQIEKVAPTNATVLITGPSGTGKELVARALHDASPRRDGPFVKTNCAAIPEDLIETELFGAVKGAYTGASETRDGKFLAASGGTLFLDEVGDMSLKVQAKVLRALQEGEIERVGGNETLTVDVRVVAATNKNLTDEVAAGRFREDLLFRLNVIPLDVPALKERRDDIPLLCRHFLELYAAENDLPRKTLSAGALGILEMLPWRGNVRELKNVVERLAILSDDADIKEDDVRRLVPGARPGESPAAGVPAGIGLPGPEEIREMGGLVPARREFERRCIQLCLDKTRGNVSQAARWLAIDRTNLHKKIQSLGIGDRATASREGDES